MKYKNILLEASELFDCYHFWHPLSSIPPPPLLILLLYSVLIQKRLKKEKRNKRRLQEALEEEVKLRDQAEHTLLHNANTHTGTDRHRDINVSSLL